MPQARRRGSTVSVVGYNFDADTLYHCFALRLAPAS